MSLSLESVYEHHSPHDILHNEQDMHVSRNHNHYSRKMHRQWSHVPPPTGPLYTKEQLLEVRRVTAERIQAEKLRKMGFTPKESMEVRYE